MDIAGDSVFKVNNRNTCSSVSVVNFEQVNTSWEKMKGCPFSTSFTAKFELVFVVTQENAFS